MSTERFDRLLGGIRDKGWNITWDTSNGIRLDGLNRDLIQKAKHTGCSYLEFGIDSGKQDTLDRIIKKGLKLEDAERIVMLCKEARIDVHTLFVVGFPGETPEGISETLRFAKHLLWKYGAIPHVCMARPLPGTELYETCERKGYLTEPVLPEMGNQLRGEVYPRVMIRTELFGPDDLETWIGRFNREVIAIVSIRTLVWLFGHPRVLVAIIRKLWYHRDRGHKEALKRVFYGGLFFKFNYLERCPERESAE
ncbi:MAG: radical SAM protein [Candidatus Eisenbacteria bacterium]